MWQQINAGKQDMLLSTSEIAGFDSGFDSGLDSGNVAAIQSAGGNEPIVSR